MENIDAESLVLNLIILGYVSEGTEVRACQVSCRGKGLRWGCSHVWKIAQV